MNKVPIHELFGVESVEEIFFSTRPEIKKIEKKLIISEKKFNLKILLPI